MGKIFRSRVGGRQVSTFHMINTHSIEDDWRARGFSCDLWTDPPGQVWKDYVHEMDELFMVVDGEVRLEMDGRKLDLKMGDEILIPAKTLHTVRNIGKTRSHWLYGYRSSKT